jgi:small-conductance mechanosensitive channel
MAASITFKGPYIWGIVLMIGFPLVMVVLGEWIERLQRRGHPATPIVRTLRNAVLPVCVLYLIIRYILGVPSDVPVARMVATVLGVTVMYNGLVLVQALMIAGMGQHVGSFYMPGLLAQLTRAFLVLVIAFYILADVWNVALDKVFAAMGIGSIVVALALQNTLSDVVSGILLVVDKPFQVGDWLRIGTVEGRVLQMNWRAVRLFTRDFDVLTIPNGVLGKDMIYNYTIVDPSHAEHVPAHFSYLDPPNRVKRALREAVQDIDGVLAEPPPEVATIAYNTEAIQYDIKYFIRDFNRSPEIREAVTSRIFYVAKRHQFRIPFPQHVQWNIADLYTQQVDAKRVILDHVPTLAYFKNVDRMLIDHLVDRASLAYYGAGECIVHMGDVTSNFYIILDGQVRLSSLNDAGHDAYDTHVLTHGDFFGETVLLQGKPSPVSVTAIEDTRVIVIAPQLLRDLAALDPRFALEMHRIIESRKRAAHPSVSPDDRDSQAAAPHMNGRDSGIDEAAEEQS